MKTNKQNPPTTNEFVPSDHLHTTEILWAQTPPSPGLSQQHWTAQAQKKTLKSLKQHKIQCCIIAISSAS